ncbi:phospholipase D family protein [Paraliomyxa miuraensis]|uniref:phospholipase D family protein n=1 Tax=Paraliomyxa miuraensis TaxID=376150 RepID=UPI00225666E3|nr:phospholipase D family protein [Paraliomyxa miuraensis]MCX4240479.1 phospholipase D family protein [Paraliomyxa miuraensis]
MTTFDATQAARLPDRDYYDFVFASVEAARRRIWVSLFICDIRPSRDLEGQVLDLVTALIVRCAVGVDVRVLLNGVAATPDIDVANLATGTFLHRHRVPHRRVMQLGNRRGSHAKLVICDDVAVVGSQNWTDDGLRQNLEDAIIVAGDATELLAADFLALWERGKGLPACP